MSWVLLVSAAARGVATVWSVGVLRRVRDWRLGCLTGLLFLLTAESGVRVWGACQDPERGLDARGEDVLELGVSLLAIATVVLTHSMLERLRGQAEALRASEDRFRRVTQATRDAVYDWDIVANRSWRNERYLQMFGPPSDTSIPWWNEQLHPEDQARVLEQLRALLEGHENYWNEEYRFRRRDGSYAHVMDRGFVVRDAGGRALRMIGAMTDLTEWKRAVAALSWEVNVNAAAAELSAALLAGETISIADMSRLVLDRAQRLTGSPLGFVGYVDGATGDLVCPTLTGEVWDQCVVPGKEIRFHDFDGLPGIALRTRQPVLTNDLARDPRARGTAPGHLPVRRFVSAPALLGEQLVGQVALANAERDYTPRDVELVQRFASIYGMALHRKWAEDAVRESEERFRQLAENIREVFWLIDLRDRRVRYVSPACEDICGVPPARLTSTRTAVWRVIHPDDRTAVWAAWRRQRAGEVTEQEFRVVRPDWTVRHVLDRAFPLCDADGRVTRIVGLTTDITDQKRVQEQVRESHELLRTVIASMTDVVYVKDLAGRYLIVNDAARRVRGGGRELLGRTDAELQAADTVRAWEEADDCVVRSGRPLTTEEQLTVEGRSRTYLTVRCPQHDAAGRVVGVVGLQHDITQLKEAEARLRQTERLASIGTLAAGIAHEINNPIGGVLMAARTALNELDGTADPALVRRCLGEIVDDAQRCGRIIKSVLRFARQEPTEKWPADVNALVRRVVDLLRERVQRDGAVVQLHLAEDVPAVPLNPTEFQQVLVNLVQNALDAGGRGTEIHVRTARHEAGVRLVVSDNGPGIAPEHLEHIFDPFHTTRTHVGGTGLGLSVVHGIVEAHGGQIEVDTPPQGGARFTITLPG